MIDEIRDLFDQYLAWLRDKTQIRSLEGAVEITTPYLDRHNDYLQIYALNRNGRMILTDDAYVIRDLKMSGCELDTPKRRDLLRLTLNGFGVQIENDSLFVNVTPENFPMKKHDLIQAMLAVNDLFYLSAPNVASLFFEDVASWLRESDIRFTSKVKIAGKSGFDHCFDFIIPPSRIAPERFLQTMNKPTRSNAEALAFSVIDIVEYRNPDLKSYAIVNDMESPPPNSVIEALENYRIRPILWSDRNLSLEELAS